MAGGFPDFGPVWVAAGALAINIAVNFMVVPRYGIVGLAGATAFTATLNVLTLYTILLRLALPFILVRLWLRGRKEPGYRQDVRERFGVYRGEKPERLVWVHAVSVGEARAAAPLVRGLLAQFPDHRVLVTCTTAAGRDTLKQVYGDSILPQARLTLESSLAAYRVGSADFLTVLTNFGSVLASELSYEQQQAQFRRALAELEPYVADTLIR